jgi:hypothetical protein
MFSGSSFAHKTTIETRSFWIKPYQVLSAKVTLYWEVKPFFAPEAKVFVTEDSSAMFMMFAGCTVIGLARMSFKEVSGSMAKRRDCTGLD